MQVYIDRTNSFEIHSSHRTSGRACVARLTFLILRQFPEMRALSLLALAASVLADQQSLDCPLRQVGLDFAQSLQPFRSPSVCQEVADALNGAIEAQNCSISPSAAAASSFSFGTRRVATFPLPTSGLVMFVDPLVGDDISASGARGAPFRSLSRALAAVRSARVAAKVSAPLAPRATLVLRAGTFFLGGADAGTLQLTAADSRVTFQAYPGEDVFISGAVPLTGAVWAPSTPPARECMYH